MYTCLDNCAYASWQTCKIHFITGSWYLHCAICLFHVLHLSALRLSPCDLQQTCSINYNTRMYYYLAITCTFGKEPTGIWCLCFKWFQLWEGRFPFLYHVTYTLPQVQHLSCFNVIITDYGICKNWTIVPLNELSFCWQAFVPCIIWLPVLAYHVEPAW